MFGGVHSDSNPASSGPTSGAEELVALSSLAGPTSRSDEEATFSVLAAEPTFRVATVDSFFSLSTIVRKLRLFPWSITRRLGRSRSFSGNSVDKFTFNRGAICSSTIANS